MFAAPHLVAGGDVPDRASRRARRGLRDSSPRERRTRGRRRGARAGRRGCALPDRRHSGLERTVEEHGWPLQLRLLLVGRIEVADRPLALPFGGQEQARERTRWARFRTRSRAPGSRRLRTTARQGRRSPTCPGASMWSEPKQQPPNAGPRMRVPVGDAAGREVDAVAAHDPAGATPRSTSPASAAPLILAVELPDERRPVDRAPHRNARRSAPMS